jgi:hypothetical protein
MPVAVTDLVMDVAITNFAEQRCEVLYSGPSHQRLTRSPESAEFLRGGSD